MSHEPTIAVLSGGVGGARLVDGIRKVVPRERLTVIANTGDDLDLWGLRICPDLDTNLYTLAGLAPRVRGWGIEGDTFATLERLRSLGAEDWFALGDQDIATHLLRTSLLASGRTLTEVTRELFRSHAVPVDVVPMSDVPAPTRIATGQGVMDFQEWLVRHRAAIPCDQVLLPTNVPASAAALQALDEADVVVITPSNPFVSIEPILNCEGVRARLQHKPVIGVSPLIGGKAVKGPLVEMFRSRNVLKPSAWDVARIYQDFLDAFVVDASDLEPGPANLDVLRTNILIVEDDDRVALAEQIVDLARTGG